MDQEEGAWPSTELGGKTMLSEAPALHTRDLWSDSGGKVILPIPVPLGAGSYAL